jgi:hypothetical protein
MRVVVPCKRVLELVAQVLIEPLEGKAGRNVFGLPTPSRDMRADKIEVSAGTRLKDESVCQSWLALLRSESR